MRQLIIVSGIILFIYALAFTAVLERPPEFKDDLSLPLPAQVDTAYCEPGQYGGRVLIGSLSDPKTFNALTVSDRNSKDLIRLMFSPLVKSDRSTHELHPGLAYKWEFSEDYTELTFHMRQGVYWSDGVPITAFDAEFTYRALNDPNVIAYAKDQMQVNGEPFIGAVVDSFTFKVKIAAPSPRFLYLAGGEDIPILPRHILEPHLENGTLDAAYGIGTPPVELVTSGPFMLERYQPGIKTVLRRNPNYWRVDTEGKRLPYLDRIIVVNVGDSEQELSMFRSGQLDMLHSIRLTNIPILEKETEKKNFTIVDVGPSVDQLLFWFNLNPGKDRNGKPFVEPHKHRWFTDIRWRKAISHALDRESLVRRVADGLAIPQHGPDTPGNVRWYNPNVVRHEYDLKIAGEYLDSMGLIDRNGDGLRQDESGRIVEFTMFAYPGLDLISTMMKDDLAKLGIRMHIREIDFKALVVKLHHEMDYEAAMIGLAYGDLDPIDGMNVWMSSGNLHLWHPNQETPATEWEARVDELMLLVGSTIDYEKRKEYYDEVQYIISYQLPIIQTYTPKVLIAHRNNCRNIKPSILSNTLIWNMEEVWKDDSL